MKPHFCILLTVASTTLMGAELHNLDYREGDPTAVDFEGGRVGPTERILPGWQVYVNGSLDPKVGVSYSDLTWRQPGVTLDFVGPNRQGTLLQIANSTNPGDSIVLRQIGSFPENVASIGWHAGGGASVNSRLTVKRPGPMGETLYGPTDSLGLGGSILHASDFGGEEIELVFTFPGGPPPTGGYYGYFLTPAQVTLIPEPSAWALLVVGGVATGAALSRSKDISTKGGARRRLP